MPYVLQLARALDWQQILGFASLIAIGAIVATLKFSAEPERRRTITLTSAAVVLTLIASYSLLKIPAHRPSPGHHDPAAVFFPDAPAPVPAHHFKLT